MRILRSTLRGLHAAISGLKSREHFDPVAGVLLVLLGLAFAGLIYGLEPAWDAAVRAVGLADALGQPGPMAFIVPLIVVLVLLLVIRWRYHLARKKVAASFDYPEARPGLVFLLSPFNPRLGLRDLVKQGEEQDALALALGLPTWGVDEETQEKIPPYEGLHVMLRHPPQSVDMRAVAFASNWGPLYAAVEVHAKHLSHLWIVASKEHLDQVPVAYALARHALNDSSRPLEHDYYRYYVDDASDIRDTVNAVGLVFDFLPEGVAEEDVITDLTGGTAVMTAGAVLATLGDRRSLQYVRQGPDYSLLITDPDNPFGVRPRTAEEIRDAKCVAEIETDVEFVREPPTERQ